jgi:hypothetical protein
MADGDPVERIAQMQAGNGAPGAPDLPASLRANAIVGR